MFWQIMPKTNLSKSAARVIINFGSNARTKRVGRKLSKNGCWKLEVKNHGHNLRGQNTSNLG